MDFDFNFDSKFVKIAAISLVGIIILVLLIGLITKGPRERAQVKTLRRSMSMLNQAVIIQNRITNGNFANKDKKQLVEIFSTRLRAKKSGEDYFVLKNGAAVIVKDVNLKCKPDGSDKCADLVIKTKGRRSTNKLSTKKHLTGTYAVELRAKRVFPAVGTDTEEIIRTVR